MILRTQGLAFLALASKAALLLWLCGNIADTVSVSTVLAAEPVPDKGFWTVQKLHDEASFRALSVPDENTISVSGSGGVILKSVDSGKSWDTIKVAGYDGIDFRSLHAFDSKRAVIVSAGSPAVILKTLDGGDIWELKYENASPQAFFDSLAFYDQANGIAISDPIDGHFLIVKTSDGGETWLPLPASQSPAAQPGEAAFAASNSCIAMPLANLICIATGGGEAVDGENDTTPQAEGSIFRRSPDDAAWQRVTIPLLRGASSGAFAIHFRDQQNGMVIGGDYKKETDGSRSAALTSDGGLSWQLSEKQPSGFRSAVVWRSNPFAAGYYAVGPSGTDWSVNGKKWQSVSSDGFHTIRISPSGTLWAAGANGRVATALISKEK